MTTIVDGGQLSQQTIFWGLLALLLLIAWTIWEEWKGG